MGDYVLSVTAAAVIFAIVSSVLDGKSTAGGLVKLIGGLYLTFVIVQPLASFQLEEILDMTESFSLEGELVSERGQTMGNEEMAELIKSRTEAYILDKAGTYRAQLSAEVTLSGDAIPVPAAVTLRGSVSPYARSQLQRMIREELNIPEEDQTWIG